MLTSLAGKSFSLADLAFQYKENRNNFTSVTRHPTCNPQQEFTLESSNKRINVCTFHGCVRVDVREFLNDRAKIKGIFLNVKEFISVSEIFPLIQAAVYRQLEELAIKASDQLTPTRINDDHVNSSLETITSHSFSS